MRYPTTEKPTIQALQAIHDAPLPDSLPSQTTRLERKHRADRFCRLRTYDYRRRIAGDVSPLSHHRDRQTDATFVRGSYLAGCRAHEIS